MFIFGSADNLSKNVDNLSHDDRPKNVEQKYAP